MNRNQSKTQRKVTDEESVLVAAGMDSDPAGRFSQKYTETHEKEENHL